MMDPKSTGMFGEIKEDTKEGNPIDPITTMIEGIEDATSEEATEIIAAIESLSEDDLKIVKVKHCK